MDYVVWHIFDKGLCDKLLSADLDKDGALDTDVLIKHTPWTGQPPTEGVQELETIAVMLHIPGARMETEYEKIPFAAQELVL
jgi:hypothetical protein